MNLSFTQEECIETLKLMILGLLAAIIINLPFISYVYDKEWSWAQGFPLGWLHVCLQYMITFFHELGHAVCYWFYGYVSLPSFDFSYGGGMTYTITGQLLPLHLLLYCGLIYAFIQLKDYPFWRYVCVVVGVFHLATAHLEFHKALCVFGGHLGEVVIATFLLYRAWFDLAPRGIAERFLNALFGFGFLVEILLENWALLHSDVFREFYFEQKEGHGFGDLDRVADMLNIQFSSVINFYFWLAIAGLVLPAILYFISLIKPSKQF